MTILGKIDNGEHLNIDRDDYFDHDERDQILRHFTLYAISLIRTVTFFSTLEIEIVK